MIIAIDGPAASGKGTLARRLARHYGFHYLDTGSLYRAVALTVLREGSDPTDQARAIYAAQTLDPDLRFEEALRTAEVGVAASIVSAIPDVRAAILAFQRNFAKTPPGAVLEGRDIGTVVCPEAEIKLFVTANAQTRAKRRFLELLERGETVEEGDILSQVVERDRRDEEREVSPMKPAQDGHLLDTTELSIEAAFETACALIDRTGQNGAAS